MYRTAQNFGGFGTVRKLAEKFWWLIILIIVHYLSSQHLADKTLTDLPNQLPKFSLAKVLRCMVVRTIRHILFPLYSKNIV